MLEPGGACRRIVSLPVFIGSKLVWTNRASEMSVRSFFDTMDSFEIEPQPAKSLAGNATFSRYREAVEIFLVASVSGSIPRSPPVETTHSRHREYET